MQSHRKKITVHVLDDAGRDRLWTALCQLEERCKTDSLAEILYPLLTELIANAVKANLKRVFFEKTEYDFDDPDSYEKGLAAFREDYDGIYNDEEYRRILKEQDLTISIDMDLDQKRLLILVVNNVSLLEQEERRIRETLSRAMQTKDLVQFARKFKDETEGKGLGLAMSVLLIKYLGFNPAYFRLYTEGDRTVARIEFPLSRDYVPLRERGDPPNDPGDSDAENGNVEV